MVATKLLGEGLGWLYDKDVDDGHKMRYLERQQEAIDENRGLWSIVRKIEGKVHASVGGVFHRPDCGSGPKKFDVHDSAIVAFRVGLRPHKGSHGHPGCWTLPR